MHRVGSDHAGIYFGSFDNHKPPIFGKESNIMRNQQNLEDLNKLSPEYIEQALIEFYKKLDLDQLTQLRMHGGLVWFTWAGVLPADLILNLYIGNPNDRNHTGWLSWEDVHIPIEADQVIEYNEDEDPDLDPVVTQERRQWLIDAAALGAEGAFNDIEDKIRISTSADA